MGPLEHGLAGAKKELSEFLFIHKAQDQYPFDDNEFLEEKYFENFTFNNSIHLDAIVYSKEKDKLPTIESIKRFREKFPDQDNVPRPKHWSGWRLKPDEIEFWLDGDNRIHERLKYFKKKENWEKVLLSP